MAKEDNFALPVPEFYTEDDVLFVELETSHREWTKQALNKAPDDMVIAIMMRTVAAGAFLNDVDKDVFLDIAAKTYDHIVKMSKGEAKPSYVKRS